MVDQVSARPLNEGPTERQLEIQALIHRYGHAVFMRNDEQIVSTRAAIADSLEAKDAEIARLMEVGKFINTLKNESEQQLESLQSRCRALEALVDQALVWWAGDGTQTWTEWMADATFLRMSAQALAVPPTGESKGGA